MASGAALLDQISIFCADTLNVFGSWYDSTICKVSAPRTPRKPFEKKKSTLDHVVRSQAAGGGQDGQNVAINWIVLVDTLHYASFDE
jgi:hypothetical protein